MPLLIASIHAVSGLFRADHLPSPGYGSQLSDAAGAVPCGLEQIESFAALKEKFKAQSIPAGQYIVFSAAHVMLYDSTSNLLHEFTYGGYRVKPRPETGSSWRRRTCGG